MSKLVAIGWLNRQALIEDIYKMIGDKTWNVAPINYTVAERAVEMTERYYGITTTQTNT